MHISVRYTPDFRQTVRVNLYLRRKVAWAYVIVGMLMLLLGVAVIGHTLELGVILIVLGVLSIPEIPVLTWVMVYRGRKALLSEVEVTLTSEGIERRTDTTTVHVTWDKLERIHERNDGWIFVANRLTRFGVPKRALSQDQQAELAAFVAARAT